VVKTGVDRSKTVNSLRAADLLLAIKQGRKGSILIHYTSCLPLRNWQIILQDGPCLTLSGHLGGLSVRVEHFLGRDIN
jgi:hypothetical protein